MREKLSVVPETVTIQRLFRLSWSQKLDTLIIYQWVLCSWHLDSSDQPSIET